MQKLTGLRASMLIGGVVLLAAGCNKPRDTGAVTSKTSEGTSNAPSAETMDKRNLALIRVVNAIPGDQSLVVFAGDSAAFSGVGYKKATPFKEIPDDRFDFKLGSPDKPLAENRENLSGGGHYTIVAMPDAGGPDKRNLRVLDDELKPVSPDKARVRVINAVPGDLEISAYIRGRKDPLFDGVNFKSEAGWNEFDPIAGTLEIRPEGKKNVLASKPNVKLEGGRSYTFVVSGRAAKPDIIVIEDDVAKDVSSQ
jgi:Domain of unknown function (DUF4397)